MRLGIIALLSMGLCGCPGTNVPPPNAQPVPPPAAPAPPGDAGPSVIVETDDVDVSPVNVPGSVLLHARWKQPGAMIDEAMAMRQVPADQRAQLRTELLQGAIDEIFEGQVKADVIASHLALDAPIDVVVMMDLDQGGDLPEPLPAISVGLTSLEQGLAASQGSPKKLAPGVWRVGTDDELGLPCAVAASAGPSPARLVCTDVATHLPAMAAFAARNLATEPSPPEDLHIDLKLRPVLDRFGPQLSSEVRQLAFLADNAKIGNAKFDDALLEAAEALSQEAVDLIKDADGMSFDISYDQAKGITVKMQLRFVGERAWVVQALTEGQAGPPSDLFWRLPDGAASADWGTFGDGKLLDRPMDIVRRMVEGALERGQVGTAADRKALASFFRVVQSKPSKWVTATGLEKNSTSPWRGEAGFDWYILGYEDRARPMQRHLSQLAASLARPAVKKKIAELADGAAVPTFIRKGAERGLPGSMRYELFIPEMPADDGSGKDLTVHIVVAPDGQNCWVGIGIERPALAKRMAALRKAGPGQLGARTDLDPLKTSRHDGGSVTTLLGYADPSVFELFALWLGQATPSPSMPLGQIAKILEKTPNKGRTPIVAFTDVDRGPAPRVTYVTTIPDGTIEDAVHAIFGLLVDSSP